MYWLLEKDEKEKISSFVEKLILSLSAPQGVDQTHQIFPYLGRKDRRTARMFLNAAKDYVPKRSIADPFCGTGTFLHAGLDEGYSVFANEWEPYTYFMASANGNLPNKSALEEVYGNLGTFLSAISNEYYSSSCDCGEEIEYDSLFFDRVPLRYRQIADHERLGVGGRNITFRGKYKCKNCGAKEKFVSDEDIAFLESLETISDNEIFSSTLIENSRINLNSDFVTYGNLFPKRSKLVLIQLWELINRDDFSTKPLVVDFLKRCFLAILPQAKYKDYRSKSQDLHCPTEKLREVNIIFRFRDQFEKMKSYLYSNNYKGRSNISCLDYREFLQGIREPVGMIFTDPTWHDGNPYFEKAQLYHPWLSYQLVGDENRLSNELVVSDAPSRREFKNSVNWWKDIEEFFDLSHSAISESGYLSLYVRPTPASKWLNTLNRIKHISRKCGYEMVACIDVGTRDPSMRVQQSAAFRFSSDMLFLFVKLSRDKRWSYLEDVFVDQIIYESSKKLQDENGGAYTFREWFEYFKKTYVEPSPKLIPLLEPEFIKSMFYRYNDEVETGSYLLKFGTPFDSMFLDRNFVERAFQYIPFVLEQLLKHKTTFCYDEFIVKLSTYLDDGTKNLIAETDQNDIRNLILVFCENDGDGNFSLRTLDINISELINLKTMDPYDFEAFVGKLFVELGFKNLYTIGRAGDRGVDLVGQDEVGRSVIIQCKRYTTNNVSAEPIQRLHSFAMSRSIERKITVTTTDFTRHAKEEAGYTNTELVNGDDLIKLIAKAKTK